jgi:predicted nucleic acid-binding protein
MGARFVSLADARQTYDTLVLDTDVLIDAYKASAQGIAPVKPLPRNMPLAVCVYTLYEFVRGQKGALFGADERRDRFGWLADQQIGRVYPNQHAARTFEAMLRTEECPRGAVDAMIAAACLVEELPLLTKNVADYESVTGLVLVEQ